MTSRSTDNPEDGAERRSGAAMAEAPSGASPARAPEAPRRPEALTAHGHTRLDDYSWLRDLEDPQVRAHLERENAYCDVVMAHTGELQARLFREIRDRIPQTDSTVPAQEGEYFYYTRYEEGRQYPIYARRRGSPDAEEQIILDVNERAVGHDFLSVSGLSVSPAHRILAFASDTEGRRLHTIRFKDLETGELLSDVLRDVTANMAWANDDRTLFYTQQDPVTLRHHRIYRHVLGSDPVEDELVYEEADATFSVGVHRTRSRAYLLIVSRQTRSRECRYLDADDPGGAFRVFRPREPDHDYFVDHLGDYFYVRTNLGAENFRLMRVPAADPRPESWEEVLPGREDVLLERFQLFRDHVVLLERTGGLPRLRIHPWNGGADHCIEFDEPAYSLQLERNPETDRRVVRFTYSSLRVPESVYDYDMETRERTLLKRDAVLGGFDPADYVTERQWAAAEDGTRIPISLVYREGARKPEGNPLLLYGYGAYGISLDAGFNAARLSLIDRGFVFAIAHVRGGQELGRRWYEDGKLLRKKNTFTDFIACAEHLIRKGYAHPDRVFAMGRSAGGLLMGAVINLRPDLFKGVVAGVPFVDALTTMLDDSIPLTTSEYDEWGDPRQLECYEYMLSYSPYDNVEAGEYPHLLVTSGLYDSQVQYWEPAKWVARLRALKTDDRRLLLRTNMGAGHQGASGRYGRYRETAFDYAFLLDLAGLSE
ncbi:MAG: S9 family peptidase [Gemmatimonadota bacterium]